MSFLFFLKKKMLIILIIIKIEIILTENEKCYSIYHCKKCPELGVCEKCEKGYNLNSDQSKCIISSNDTKSSNETINSEAMISSFKTSSSSSSPHISALSSL